MMKPTTSVQTRPHALGFLELGLLGLLWGGNAACGTNAPELPPGLAGATPSLAAGGAASGARYPSGPYGTEVGDVLQDLCFEQVWDDPKSADYAVSELEPRCFSELYDADSDQPQLLLINTAAGWCAACRNEWGGASAKGKLADEVKAREDRGLHFLGLMFQDQDAKPATDEDIVRWAEAFEVDIPFGLDDSFLMGLLADERLQPFNGLIDLRTMELVAKFVGDQPTVLFARIDEELAAGSAAAKTDDGAE